MIRCLFCGCHVFQATPRDDTFRCMSCGQNYITTPPPRKPVERPLPPEVWIEYWSTIYRDTDVTALIVRCVAAVHDSIEKARIISAGHTLITRLAKKPKPDEFA